MRRYGWRRCIGGSFGGGENTIIFRLSGNIGKRKSFLILHSYFFILVDGYPAGADLCHDVKFWQRLHNHPSRLGTVTGKRSREF